MLHVSSPKMYKEGGKKKKKKNHFRLASSPLIHNSMTGNQFIQC